MDGAMIQTMTAIMLIVTGIVMAMTITTVMLTWKGSRVISIVTLTARAEADA